MISARSVDSNPTEAKGWARNPAESLYPAFWRSLVIATSPSMASHRKEVVRDFGPLKIDLDFLDNGSSGTLNWGSGEVISDGVDDSFKIPDHARHSPPEISVVVRFRYTANPIQYDGLCSKTTSGSWADGWGCWINSNNTINFFVGTWGTSASATLLLSDRDYHTMVGTYDGLNIRVYLDGIEGTASSRAGGYAVSSASIDVGKMQGTVTQYTCPLAWSDFIVFSRAFTSVEARFISRHPRAPFVKKKRVLALVPTAAPSGPFVGSLKLMGIGR